MILHKNPGTTCIKLLSIIEMISYFLLHRLVDTRNGHVKKIKGSGEVPEYCLRPDFGQMPGYLLKRNRIIQKELDKRKFAEGHKESLCKLINEEERQKILDVSITKFFSLLVFFFS